MVVVKSFILESLFSCRQAEQCLNECIFGTPGFESAEYEEQLEGGARSYGGERTWD